ncbi:helix-turn-helix transcriptional regulator [Schlegelella sp. S2-27]|uniref:Helix-turn-helix transcriptional regulator n=1 Tax=Caldimonas mangrovi TaxID=2944811 RepID=A0ABT0YVS5_9BURK|nr:helix-turn-helix transcriptional regulator [Caldimonas mangrovi]MCM5682399.1 helix-turn-helix transcriptional regulator [Caldimonas mangrovi]
MVSRSPSRTKPDLAEFLKQKRQRLTPADVGLSAGGRRRTPGLRREEVAAMAGVGLTWYTWFEQGRDIQVSEQFLLSLAYALKLDDIECSHLFMLAHRRPPRPEVHPGATVRPLVQQLLDELGARPAYVCNLWWDVIAWNEAADRLFGLEDAGQNARNLLRRVFADTRFRRRMPAWNEDARKLLAQFRHDFAVASDDPAMTSLIDELRAASAEFRYGWREHLDGDHARGIGSLLAADGTPLSFEHESLVVDEHRHLRLVIYFQHQGPRAPALQQLRAGSKLEV